MLKPTFGDVVEIDGFKKCKYGVIIGDYLVTTIRLGVHHFEKFYLIQSLWCSTKWSLLDSEFKVIDRAMVEIHSKVES